VAEAAVEWTGHPDGPSGPKVAADPLLEELATWLSDLAVPVPSEEVGQGAQWTVRRRLVRRLPVGLLVDEEMVFTVETLSDQEVKVRVAQHSRSAASCPACAERTEGWTENGDGWIRWGREGMTLQIQLTRRATWTTVDERTLFARRTDSDAVVQVRIESGSGHR